MKKALKFLGLGLVALIVLLVVVGLFLPSAYAVERSVTIPGATAAKVQPFLNDLTKWPAWEPWTSEDPTIQTTVGTPSAGVGANQTWAGDSGAGNLTLTASTPTGVEFDLTFEGEGDAHSSISCSENSDAVTVTWKMEGDNGWNLIGRYFGLMMDSFVGPMFELGMNRLKAAVDAAPDPEPEVVEEDTRTEEVVEAAEVVGDAATKLLDSLR